MGWIQTYSGRRFDPLEPRPEQIEIVDIAHALSLLCRFKGHCLKFYSVAEHSVRVSRALPPDDALWGLMHDAAEAYLSDVPRPLKARLPGFQEAEDRLLELIAAKFGLGWPMPEAVARADALLLSTEARDLMAPPPESWGLDVAPLPGKITPWPAPEAEASFLRRFGELARAGR
jgi:hypothetical protein